jgi:hypothetical protein
MREAIWVMLIAAAGGVLVALLRAAAAARTQRFVERLDVRMTCPLMGADVDARLALDERTGRYLAVDRCARFVPGLEAGGGEQDEAPPATERSTRCDQRCLHLLNLGIPLRPRAVPGGPTPEDEP